MDQLSCEGLGKLLEKKGLHEVATAIVENEVTGQCLVELTELEIKELASKIGDRVKLKRQINQYKVMFLELISSRSYHFHMFSLKVIHLQVLQHKHRPLLAHIPRD